MNELYKCEFYEKNDDSTIIKYINENKKKVLISNKCNRLPIHLYCWSDCEKSIKIINILINNNPNNLSIHDINGYLPIHFYCWSGCKKSIEIIDYLLYNYDINKIIRINNCPTYVGYYLYKIYNWRYYDKKLFLYMIITKLQKLIKVYLIKKKLC